MLHVYYVYAIGHVKQHNYSIKISIRARTLKIVHIRGKGLYMKNQSQHFARFTGHIILLIQEPSCEATVFDIKTFSLPAHFSHNVTEEIADGRSQTTEQHLSTK